MTDTPDKDSNFEVLTVGEVRRRYRLLGIKAQEVEFDEADVPEALKHLIPLARVWGIGDDLLRDDLMDAADPEALIDLKRAVSAVDDDLMAWLTSPECLGTLSQACSAFGSLLMVADAVSDGD